MQPIRMTALARTQFQRLVRGISLRQVRLICGLVLFAYLVSHFLNHALGNISLDALAWGVHYHVLFWQFLPVAIIFYTAALLHGYRDHMVFTALGDAVNVAARLQDMTKSLGCEAILSEEVRATAGLAVDALPQQQVVIRGRNEPMMVRTVANTKVLSALVDGVTPADARSMRDLAHI